MKQAAAPNPEPERYRFDGFVVDVAAHTLTRETSPLALEPKAFAVLLALLRRPGELQGRDDLLDQVWGHRHVTPGVLTRAIAQLRAVLVDDPHRPGYIQTQHGLGYRFVGRLEADANADVGAGADADADADADQGRDLGLRVAEPQDEEPDAEALAPLALAPGRSPLEVSPPEVSLLELTANPLAESAAEPAAQADVPRPYAGTERRRKVSVGRWAVVVALAALVTWAGFGWLRTPALPASPSIAVLPFTSISADPDDTYFAEGLAVEMHDALAGVAGLIVAAQLREADAFAGSDVKAMGEAMGVATILDATVRRDRNRVRISARLSDTSTGYTLWNRTYDRELSDVFATQSEIAGEVVRSVMGVLPRDQDRLARRLAPTSNLAAFDAYLRGLHLLAGTGEDEVNRAAGHFRQALQADSGFTRAQLGICRAGLSRFRRMRDAGALQAARLACLRAQEMDPQSGEADLVLGDLYRVQGDGHQALVHYAKLEKSVSLRPAAWLGMGLAHAELGQDDKAMEYLGKAIAARPGDAIAHGELGYLHYLRGDVSQAIASYRKATALQPGDAELWSTLGALHFLAEELDEAGRAYQRSMDIEPTDAALNNLGALRFHSGDYAGAAVLFERAVRLGTGDFMIWGHLGDALRARPETTSQAHAAYAKAAGMARPYLEIKANDAQAMAALGWYQANLGEADPARELVSRAEALGTERAEVALLNAQTLTQLGDTAGARQRIATAREAGMTEIRIRNNPSLAAMPDTMAALKRSDR